MKNRNFFLLWSGQIISQLGDRLSQMALIGLVYQLKPGSAIQIAKVLSFTIIPVFLIGPFAGAYVDRWNRRRTMYICDIMRAFLVALIPFFFLAPGHLAWLYTIIFLSFSIGRFYVPAKMSIIPELLDKKFLITGNSLVNTTGMLAAVLGFGISGLIVELRGPKTAFYLDALSFLVSGISIFLISKQTLASERIDLKAVGMGLVKKIEKSIFTDIKEGVLYFIRHKEIRFTAAVIFLLWSALGAVYVVTIVFVQNTLHSATKDLGFLIVFLGLGLFFGSIVYGSIGHRISPYRIIYASLVTSGLMLAVFAAGISMYPCFPVAAFLSVLVGLSISPIMIASNTIVHNASSSEMMGKIFSSLEIVIHLGFLTFMFVASALADKFPHVIILSTIGILIAATGAFNLALNKNGLEGVK